MYPSDTSLFVQVSDSSLSLNLIHGVPLLIYISVFDTLSYLGLIPINRGYHEFWRLPGLGYDVTMISPYDHPKNQNSLSVCDLQSIWLGIQYLR